MENQNHQTETPKEKFAQWGVIQLMGHVTYAGYIEDITVFGKPQIKLTVPKVEGDKEIPSFIKFISPNSLYDITPVAEEFATKMAAQLRKAPIEDYAHNQVIQSMAKDYVKKMSAAEVAKILLTQKTEVKELEF